MLCNADAIGYNWTMKPVLFALSMVAVLLSLNGCRTAGKQSPNVGPFDSHGNYVEAWADDPSKWRPYTPKEVEGDVPRIAKNEQPPENSVPLVTGGTSVARTTVVTRHTVPDTTRTVARTSAKPKAEAERTVARTGSKPRAEAERTVAKTSARSKPDTERTARSTSKSKSSVAKAKPKAKSSTVRHTVKKGDSLSSLASKYGSSVSAIKEANGISGTMIRDGKTLVIPRRK